MCSPALGGSFFKEYIIYTSGIKIGKLTWRVEVNDKEYSNKIELENGGLLSALYTFKGRYFSSGSIVEKTLIPKKYTHVWKTNKVNKTMSLVFNNNKLESLEQTPVESEKLRFDIFKINETKDPLSSFLQIIYGAKKSLVVDGRRIYTMNAVYDKKTKEINIELTNYSNLWADHKRSDFEKISFQKSNGDFLPTKIHIYFDGRVFKIKEG